MNIVSQRLAESVARATTETFEVEYNNSKTAQIIIDIVSGAGTAVAATGTVTFASVLAGDTVTIDGNVYTAVTGAKADNTEFSIDGTDTVDAADLADSIVNDSRATNYTASADTEIVTVTSTTGLPSDGDAITLASSNGTRLAVSGATLSGGVDLDTLTVTIDGYDTASKEWYNILTSAVLSTVGTTVLRVGLDYVAASNTVAKDFLPRKFRIVGTKANAAPIVYSIGSNSVE